MRKKLFTTIISLALCLGLSLLIFIIVITAKGHGISKGKCYISSNGSYLIILNEKSPIVMSDTNDKDLFKSISSGDEILVIHDGINETYPGSTGIYFCIKIDDGEAEDLPYNVIKQLNEMGW